MSLLLLFDTPPANTLAIVNHANTSVAHLGLGIYRVTKTTADGWDAGAVSSNSIIGPFRLWVEPVSATQNVHVGINDNPTATADQTTMEHSLDLNGLGELRVYVLGSLFDGPFTYVAGDRIWMDRNAAGDIEVRQGPIWSTATSRSIQTVAGSAYTGVAYFDSSLYQNGARYDASYFVADPGEMSAAASFGFTTSGTLTGQGALAGASALTFAPAGILKGAAALSGASTLTFTTAGILKGGGPLAGTSSLTFTTAGAVTGRGALVGATSLVFSPAGTVTGQGGLSGASSLNFAPVGVLRGAGSLSGASSLTLAPSGSLTGAGVLSGASNLTFTTSGTLDIPGGVGVLTGSTSLTFSTAGNVVGLASLSGSAGVVFALSGTLIGTPPSWVETPSPSGISIANDNPPSSTAFTATGSPLAVTVGPSSAPGAGAFVETTPPPQANWS